MSASQTPPVVDKSIWTDGPWQREPDRVEWEHAGLPCLMQRHPRLGFWCGYAAVPPGHRLHGVGYDDARRADGEWLDVHGGLTYANRCRGEICHVPKPGEPDDVWWFGFDCGHAGDFVLGTDAVLRGISAREGEPYDHDRAVAANDFLVEVYRTVEYVRAQTNALAEQLVWDVVSAGRSDAVSSGSE